jgi:NAD(P)-dependent dehydrogenase (short-subunit alcohol dehydrogenase family)
MARPSAAAEIARVLVVGGTRGIGLGVARFLAERWTLLRGVIGSDGADGGCGCRGVRVAVAGRDGGRAAAVAAGELVASGGASGHIGVACDVRDAGSVQSCFGQVRGRDDEDNEPDSCGSCGPLPPHAL